MYSFARCQPHNKCPDLLRWYLILEPSNLDALMKLHKGVAYLYFCKFGMDPHIKPDSEEGVLKNPIRLAALWLQTVEKFLMRGETILVNWAGGMMTYDKSKILTVVERDEMIWPSDDYNADEIITISRWPKGRHYYLSSSADRVFVPPKHTRRKDAKRVAEMYTDNIQIKENTSPLPSFQ